ncbi:MAG: hypothetical protein J2P48_19160, partial [Alphaproteobacteria bacterium]|nr:hypothetical protein [Alphaproteobacteria bacterium]
DRARARMSESPCCRFHCPVSGLDTAEAAEIVVAVSGLDETILRTVHARTSYIAHEVLWNYRFADVFGQTEDGRLAIDYRRFHNTEPIQGSIPG